MFHKTACASFCRVAYVSILAEHYAPEIFRMISTCNESEIINVEKWSD